MSAPPRRPSPWPHLAPAIAPLLAVGLAVPPAVSLAALLGAGCQAADPFAGEVEGVTPRSGAVVSEHPLASAAGLRILRRGGNAADAAVTTALVLAVVYPQAGNLGGGGFALWVPHGGEAEALDFRETTPAGYEPRLYLDEQGEVVPERSVATPLAVGVPGSPAGLFALFRRHGSGHLTLAELCSPAIELARKGFPVDPWLARSLRSEPTRRRLTADPAAAALFYPDGEPLEEGQRLRQPDLARTLRRFSRGGAQAFYVGPTAEAIVDSLARADERAGGVTRGGGMTAEDLAGYEVIVRPPVVGWFRGHEVIGMGPPSSGGVVLLQVLAILAGFPLDVERESTRDEIEVGAHPTGDGSGISARALHWWIEALRVAFADRAEHLGDPDPHGQTDFRPVPVAELLSPAWIAERRVSIGDRANPEVGPLELAPPVEGSQTTHVSVIDRDGNAVSLTTTLNGSFGSGILAQGAGFLLNNELDDFSIRAGTPNMYGLVGGAANQLAPHRRPLSSMTPTVVREGGRQLTLVLGSPGGPRIITSVMQVVLRVLVYDQDLPLAVAAPRLHQQWKPATTRFEQGWETTLIESLVNRHDQPVQVQAGAQGFGSIQAIHVGSDGTVSAVSDPRRGGVAGIEGRPLPPPRRPPRRR